jgi:glutamine synthetase
MTKATKEKVLKDCEKNKIQFINLQFSDIDGITKSVQIPVDQFPEALDRGKWFDGSSIEGFARIAESDMYLLPDLSTFCELPFDDEPQYKSARVICDVMQPDGQPFAGDPRYILKKNIIQAKAMGYEYMVGPEIEFFLFAKDEDGDVDLTPTDGAGYFDFSDDWAGFVRKEIAIVASKMGIQIETIHHEVSTSQHEIDFKYSDALSAADNVITLKFIIKAIAERFGLYATFMPKPVFGINGSGMHVHQSLAKAGKNVFYDKKDEYSLSAVAKSFIAGQLTHAKSICMVLSPLVNSYKRLVPGYEAPVYLSWARINRSALIRVPQISSGNSQACRIELRSPDPACNPYLAFSVMLASGLDGIKNKFTPPKAIEENIYDMDKCERDSRKIETLPDSLNAAVAQFSKCSVCKDSLGEHIFNRLIESNLKEWDNYKARVSQWEIEEYLNKF